MAPRLLAAALGLGGLLLGPAGRLAAQGGEGASRFARLGNTRLHYISYGAGPEALVLIHGWSGDLGCWRQQLPALARRARVIALDLPGHGRSDKPALTYSMDLFAQAVEAVLRAEGVERAVLVGHSMGTQVARQFSRKYPENGMAGGNLSEAAGEHIHAAFRATPQHVLVSAFEAMTDPAIWTPDQIPVPVLVLRAKSDFYPPDIEPRDRAVAPKLQFEMWDGVGHFLMMEQPARFNEAVIGFLDSTRLLSPR